MSGAGHILPTLTTPVCQCDPAWPGATPTNVWVAKKLYNIKTCVGEEGRGGTFKDIVLSIRMAWPYMVWPGLTWWAWHMLPPASEFYDCIWTWTQMDNELGASGECPLLGLCLENTNYIYIPVLLSTTTTYLPMQMSYKAIWSILAGYWLQYATAKY